MNVVIDAQIIKHYFMESLSLKIEIPLTAKVTPLIDRLGQQDKAFLDDSGQIEQEWRNLVDPEWFQAWLGDLFLNDGVQEIAVQTELPLRKELAKLGFPTQGREGHDFWYIRTAKAVTRLHATKTKQPLAFIISEDLDFYEPKGKNKIKGADRLDLLQSNRSSIGQFLMKQAQIQVYCVANYLKES